MFFCRDDTVYTVVKNPAFLTELEQRGANSYLKSFAIASDYFNQLKRTVRVNFLTYLEVRNA